MSDEDDLLPDDQDDLFPSDQPNAANPVAVRKRVVRTRLEAKEGALFWSTCLSTKTGRRELYRVLSSAHAFETIFACGPNGFPQPEATWLHAGEQGLGQRIFLSWLKIDKDRVFLMLEENDPRFSRPRVQPTAQQDR